MAVLYTVGSEILCSLRLAWSQNENCGKLLIYGPVYYTRLANLNMVSYPERYADRVNTPENSSKRGLTCSIFSTVSDGKKIFIRFLCPTWSNRPFPESHPKYSRSNRPSMAII